MCDANTTGDRIVDGLLTKYVDALNEGKNPNKELVGQLAERGFFPAAK